MSMQRPLTAFLIAVAAGAVVLVGPSAASDEIREITRSFSLKEQKTIRLDLPVAELQISGSDAREVAVEFTAICKRDHDCKQILDELDFKSSGSGSTLRIDLVGYPAWGKGRVELEGVVRVPRSLEIEIELGVGEIEMRDLAGDLRVELGVGEINAWLEEAKTRSVTLDAGVGEVELYGSEKRLEGRRSMLVGSEAHWSEGQGEARIFLEVGVGEISVWME